MTRNYESHVTYEQAAFLKRAGFNWPVTKAFSQKIRLEPFSMGSLKTVSCKMPKNFNDDRKGCGEGVLFYSAPTLALAAKWLREVLNWHISVNPEYDGTWYYHICPIGGVDEEGDSGFNTYENALSAGISEVLTMIK